MNQSYYSKKLNQNFYPQPDGSVIFDDKVQYSKTEMIRLSQVSDETIRVVHAIKKEFDGEVVR